MISMVWLLFYSRLPPDANNVATTMYVPTTCGRRSLRVGFVIMEYPSPGICSVFTRACVCMCMCMDVYVCVCVWVSMNECAVFWVVPSYITRGPLRAPRRLFCFKVVQLTHKMESLMVKMASQHPLDASYDIHGVEKGWDYSATPAPHGMTKAENPAIWLAE